MHFFSPFPEDATVTTSLRTCSCLHAKCPRNASGPQKQHARLESVIVAMCWVLPPFSNSWIINILWSYIALSRTPQHKLLLGGGSTQAMWYILGPQSSFVAIPSGLQYMHHTFMGSSNKQLSHLVVCSSFRVGLVPLQGP